MAAHAALLRSDPEAGASLAEPPTAIVLWFSEPVELRYSTLTVLRQDGSVVPTGSLASVGTPDEPGLTAELRGNLARGSYTVVYSVLSAVDGHVSGGFFSFTIGDALMPSLEQETALASLASSSAVAPVALSSGVRWMNLLAQGVLAGMLFFLVVVLLPVAGRSDASGVPARHFRRLALIAVILLLVGHLASAVIQAMNASRSTSPRDVIDVLPSILGKTRFGGVWLARGVLLEAWAVVAWALLRGARLPAWHGRGRLLWSIGLLVSALVLLTTSLGSHAATRGSATSWPVLTDWLHLIVTSIWIGGLAGLLLALEIAPTSDARHGLVARFSRLALVAVLGIIATGVVSAWVEAFSWDGLVSTDYGAWLIVKLVLVAGALGFGGHHLLNVRPRLDVASPDGEIGVPARFRRTLRLELLLLTGVVLVTGVLTGTPPARDLLQRVDILGSTRLTGGASITLRVSPPEVGANQYSVIVAPSDPDTFGEVQRVYLRFTPLAVDPPAGAEELAGSQRIQLRQASPGDASTFIGSGSFITLDGDWDATVVIRRAGVAQDLEASFGITARDGKLLWTGIPEPVASRSNAAIALGGVWLAAAAILVVGAWRFRRQRLSLTHGLIGLAAVAIVLGSFLIALGSGLIAT